VVYEGDGRRDSRLLTQCPDAMLMIFARQSKGWVEEDLSRMVLLCVRGGVQ
jgi:hypothetical protein